VETTGVSWHESAALWLKFLASSSSQPLHHKAWGLAAVAADPTYFNTFNQLSIGYQHCHQSNKALEMANKARTFPESQTSWTLRERLALLMALFMAMIPERV
jgi:hypothetical protein